MTPTNLQDDRPRDRNGCFVNIHSTHAAQRRREREIVYRARNHVIANLVFEKMMDATFIKGERQDWIPSSASEGPLVVIAETIIKKKFWLSRLERGKLLRFRYFDGAIMKQQGDLPKMEVREANNRQGPKYRVRVYRGRRLPFLNRGATEMKLVRAWIDFVKDNDALAVSSAKEAYDVVRKTIKTYIVLDYKRFYVGYPKALQYRQERQASTASESQCRENTGGEASDLVPAGEHVAEINAILSNAAHVEAELEREAKLHTSKCLDAALNDRIFFFLCQVLDEKCVCLSGIFGTYALQQRASDQRGHANNILSDIIEYSRGIYFGIKDKEEHLARKERMSMTLDVLKELRRLRNLPSYEEMTWESVRRVEARLSSYGSLAPVQSTYVPVFLGRRAQHEGPSALRETLPAPARSPADQTERFSALEVGVE